MSAPIDDTESEAEGVWLQPLVDWPDALRQTLRRTPVVIRISLASVRGSAPREPGVVMLLSAVGLEGTIGGGRLEWQALTAARAMLEDASEPDRLERLVLGADLGQCCGGVVELWLERYARSAIDFLDAAVLAARRGPVVLRSTLTSAGVRRRLVHTSASDEEAAQLLHTPRARAMPRIRRPRDGEVTLWERLDEALPPLWLFGAGHVGQALVRILLDLPVRVTWVDSRAELLPFLRSLRVRTVCSQDPVAMVSGADSGSSFLVLTHSHTLDYALCKAILLRGDCAWVGLIGSRSKAVRFRSRLAREGLPPEVIARLVCPIGVGGIRSKWPAAIAVGVAAQLLQDLEARVSTDARGDSPAGIEVCQGIACANCGAGDATPRRSLHL